MNVTSATADEVRADDATALAPGSESGRLLLLQIGAEWQTEVAGGANRYTYELARELVDREVDQHWVVVGTRPESGSAKCRVTAAAPASLWLPSRLHALRRTIRRSIASCHVVTSHFSLNAYAALSTLRSTPHVVHFHGPWADESAAEGAGRVSVAIKRRIERSVYSTADRVITLSEAFKQVVTEQYGIDPSIVRVVPGGVDCQAFATAASCYEARAHLDWPNTRPIVFCLRRLARRMGLSTLVDAFAEVRSREPEALLLIGGKGPLASELQKQVEALGLQHNVRLLGFVSDEDLPLAYRAADLSIVPTESLEGFGLIALESLAAGTPVLVTPVGGLPEVVEGWRPDLVMADSTAKSMAESMKAAIRGDANLPDADSCRAYVRENFDWPKIAARVLEVYREVV